MANNPQKGLIGSYASSHKQKYVAAHVRAACDITGADRTVELAGAARA
jgi:hypothetical protein